MTPRERDTSPASPRGAPSGARAPGDLEARRTRSRIAYFMLFRLAMLAGFTVLAGTIFYTRFEEIDATYAAFVWLTLVLGYALTILWARWLPRASDPAAVASLQTAFDILVAAVVVQMTGGVDSGFATLYLIAVLGAAVMGGPRQTWAAAGACVLIYLVMGVLQYFEWVTPYTTVVYRPLDPVEHWTAVARTVGGLVGVSVLSSYLNAQLTRSVSQVGNLRALNEHIVQSLSSGLITLDQADRVMYFNPMARALLELQDAQVGHPAEVVLPGMQPASEGFEARQELEVTTSSGRALRIGLTRSALRDADGQRIGSIINFQDVTPLHELAQQARRNERLAALGRLASSVAHEIRNPLAAISGSAELLGSVPLEGDDERLLQIIQRESNRLSGLISDLLAFTRPRAPQRRRTDLRRAALEVSEAFRTDPAARGIDVHAHPGEEVWAELDPAHLSQVLWNLLRNAAEALGGRGRVRLVVYEAEGDAVIEVHDDGPGIAPEHLESIFEPFFTTKDDGTGFGLAVAHRMVEENGGTITATSNPGAGTIFSLRFPSWRDADPAPNDSGVLEIP